MNIANRIQKLRKQKGISQEQLADVVGVSRQAVSKWESDQNVPDVDKIIALSEYFDVTTDYILKGIEKPLETSIEAHNNENENQKQNQNTTNNCWRIFPIAATGLNYTGLIVMLIDAFSSWNTTPFAMTDRMVISKIVSIVFMAAGTTIFSFYLALDNNKEKYDKIRKYLMVNIVPYAGIAYMLAYFLAGSIHWPVIIYVIVVFITEVVLLRKRK